MTFDCDNWFQFLCMKRTKLCINIFLKRWRNIIFIRERYAIHDTWSYTFTYVLTFFYQCDLNLYIIFWENFIYWDRLSKNRISSSHIKQYLLLCLPRYHRGQSFHCASTEWRRRIWLDLALPGYILPSDLSYSHPLCLAYP